VTVVSDGSNAGVVRLYDGTPVTVDYDSGSVQPTIGETVTGASSARTGTLSAYTLDSGTFGGGDAAGTLTLIGVTGGAAFTNNEALNGSTSGADFATADGTGVAAVGGTEIWRGAVAATAGTVVSPDLGEGRSFPNGLYLYLKNAGSVSIGYTDNR